MNDSPVDSEILEMQKCQERLQCLEELTEFTSNCKNQLDDLLETLGWTREKAASKESMEVCPYDSNHRVPSRSMERHKASCRLSKMGYSREEQAEMLDPSVCYEKSNITSFTMDKHTQQQVILQSRANAPPLRMEGLYSQGEYSKDPPDVPQNHKRATSDLTVADRLALYDHVTRATSQPKEQAGASNNEDLYIDLVAKLKKGDDQNGPKSHLELMAEMRDYKRRRQSYRAKNVHITKKSYTEVVREVIEVHSEELSRQWKDDQREVEKLGETKRNPHRRTEDRRSQSTESRHSHAGPREGHRKRHRSSERSRAASKERSRAASKERSRAGSKERSRAGSKERSRAGSKERSRAGSKERSRAGSKERSRAGSKERSRAASKERSRAGSKERSRAGSKERSRAGSKERSRAGSKERSRAGSKERSRAGSKERSRAASKERSRAGSKERSRAGSKERSRAGSKERSRAASKERSRAGSKERSRAGSKERSRAGSKERSRAASKERSRAASKERSRAASKERSRAASKERSRESSPEHKQKDSKKKRKRDSRSPDERHHDKKKKKKKRKEDKEK